MLRRVAPGICVRLYAEGDLATRPEFTEPEILRTNLASVILQMTALGLGDIAAFPFVDAPDARSIKDGVALLEELGALDASERDVRTGYDRNCWTRGRHQREASWHRLRCISSRRGYHPGQKFSISR